LVRSTKNIVKESHAGFQEFGDVFGRLVLGSWRRKKMLETGSRSEGGNEAEKSSKSV
jgi:hypothetical protein